MDRCTLSGVGGVDTVVTQVPNVVAICVFLIWVRGEGAVVDSVNRAVAIEVSCIGWIDFPNASDAACPASLTENDLGFPVPVVIAAPKSSETWARATVVRLAREVAHA